MLDILKWAVESVPNTLLLLVLVWMVCPWLHSFRIFKNNRHEVTLGPTEEMRKKIRKTVNQVKEQPKKDDQITVSL